MARPLRVEYAGAIHHVLSRGDRRQPIVWDDTDRSMFLSTLEKVCLRTGWQIHAYCLMTNHLHLVIETPRSNLSTGMQWMLGFYTQRFNRRHRFYWHLFWGRFKSLLIDERDQFYYLIPMAYGVKTRMSYDSNSARADRMLTRFCFEYLNPAIRAATNELESQESPCRNDRPIPRGCARGVAMSRYESVHVIAAIAIPSLIRRGWQAA